MFLSKYIVARANSCLVEELFLCVSNMHCRLDRVLNLLYSMWDLHIEKQIGFLEKEISAPLKHRCDYQ